MLEVLLKDC